MGINPLRSELYSLLQPAAGLFSSVNRVMPQGSEPQFSTRIVHLGDVSSLVKLHTPMTGRARRTVSGAGTSLDDDHALMLALSEGLERYSACVFAHRQFIMASAEDLGDEAIDLDTIPRCSVNELADPRCPLVAPDKRTPIRWVRAISLLDGRLVYAPAVMVYMSAGWTSRAERIAHPISTGCAAHTSYEAALWRAVLEVVERDAISIVWLQQLPLPRIEIDEIPDVLLPYWQKYQKSVRDLEYLFFDATADLGFPTVYGLQRSPHDRRVATLVTCSTDASPVTALAKVIRDMGAARIAARKERQVPARWEDFRDVMDGAIYMGRAEQADAFGFLLSSRRTVALSRMARLPDGTDRQTLRYVLERFRQLRMDVYGVDVSSDEAIRCGIRVVRAIVPALQPLSFHYRARYLGHPRLYQLPATLGYQSRGEKELNKWPQPFG